MTQQVRVRFAPSPTGALHVGGVRTALYNYLFARKNGGKFILRIEDTDQTRFVPGAESYIMEAMRWCGFEPDEGPEQGGEYGPYRQSERKEMYRQYAEQLVASGHAYYAFDTPEELEKMREELKAKKVANPTYNAITRMTMTNSVTLSEEEVKTRIDSGEPYVIRLKMPSKEEVRFQDLVRDWVMVHSSTLDDKVIMKGDGMPTYHLANVVDDHLMKITHVIRGEEWLPSAPLHVLLYRFLGWEDTMPQFAHLPLLLKPDGNGKLSKRDAEKHGFPIFPLKWENPADGEQVAGFREDGYLSGAFVNFIALLGWNPGTEQEVFSMEELIEAFSVERITKSGARFDIAKAKWYNEHYLRAESDEQLGAYLQQSLKAAGIEADDAKAQKVASIMRDRITFPADIWEQGQFFFRAPQDYDEQAVSKKWNEDAVKALLNYKERLASLGEVTAANAKEALQATLDELGFGFGKAMPALRIAATGAMGGPDMMEIIEVIGKDEMINRIDQAIAKLS